MAIVQEHTVFIASPGDTEQDRHLVPPLVDEINSSFAPEGQRLRVLRWERDARPDAGRPQALINEQLGSYDILIAVLWRRMGTPTGGFGSGTEEEIARALQRRVQDGTGPVFLYFCRRPFWPESLEDVEQLRRVLEFRAKLEREQVALPWNYASEVELRDQLRSHLCKCLRDAANPAARPTRGTRPDPSSVEALKRLWPRLDDTARAALCVAYNENRAAGDPGIATEHLFAAMQRVADDEADPLKRLLREFNPDALPKPLQGAVLVNPYILDEQPWLSHCVANSIRRLLDSAPADRKLSGADIFADIAKHGTGSSVARLRQYGIQPDDIDAAVTRAQLDVVHTLSSSQPKHRLDVADRLEMG